MNENNSFSEFSQVGRNIIACKKIGINSLTVWRTYNLFLIWEKEGRLKKHIYQKDVAFALKFSISLGRTGITYLQEKGIIEALVVSHHCRTYKINKRISSDLIVEKPLLMAGPLLDEIGKSFVNRGLARTGFSNATQTIRKTRGVQGTYKIEKVKEHQAMLDDIASGGSLFDAYREEVLIKSLKRMPKYFGAVTLEKRLSLTEDEAEQLAAIAIKRGAIKYKDSAPWMYERLIG